MRKERKEYRFYGQLAKLAAAMTRGWWLSYRYERSEDTIITRIALHQPDELPLPSDTEVSLASFIFRTYGDIDAQAQCLLAGGQVIEAEGERWYIGKDEEFLPEWATRNEIDDIPELCTILNTKAA